MPVIDLEKLLGIPESKLSDCRVFYANVLISTLIVFSTVSVVMTNLPHYQESKVLDSVVLRIRLFLERSYSLHTVESINVPSVFRKNIEFH